MQINISEETAKAIIKALEKQINSERSTLGEIVAAREALEIMREFSEAERSKA